MTHKTLTIVIQYGIRNPSYNTNSIGKYNKQQTDGRAAGGSIKAPPASGTVSAPLTTATFH